MPAQRHPPLEECNTRPAPPPTGWQTKKLRTSPESKLAACRQILQSAVKSRSTMKPSSKRREGSRRRLPAQGNAEPASSSMPGSNTESAAKSRPGDINSSYTRPPHPYDTGILHKVNICPACAKYTVIELERPASSDPDSEALRARFRCDLCENHFDLAITLFDPRGVPGVTLYEGEDRFVPPVPYRASYPCPRCWKNTHTSFECMVLHVREETKLPCEPACAPDQLNPEAEEPETKRKKQKSIKQVMRLL